VVGVRPVAEHCVALIVCLKAGTRATLIAFAWMGVG
jgi:hypothetical protein